ncbi:MAG TPA: type VI secretion system tube protein Hcp, partial [Xanthobacteraceae bacterium]|nr:type VI secretion system tube protein Hcp [Xanthobacteraceae bacterium]
MSASPITANNSEVSGNEDTVIALLLEGAATDSHFAITGFQVTQLPTNGTLYLDSALSILVAADSVLPSTTGSLLLYFRPSQDFNGAVDFKYVSTGAFASAGPGNADAYYLTLDGLDGGVRVAGHEGSFAVEDFSFDIEQIIDSTTGTGSGKGKAEPSPLIVDLVPGSSLTELLKNGASGKHFTGLSLEGVIVNEEGERTVYDLRLAEVLVTKVTDTSGVDHAEFSFTTISITTTGMNDDGTLAQPRTFFWNVDTTEIGDDPFGGAVAGPLTSAGPGNADAYYLTLDGVDGGVRAAGHDGSFAVADFSFDIEQLIDSTSGGGSGKGKAEPSPLIVDLV